MSRMKKRKRPTRKAPVIESLVVGMLESSAHIDSVAAKRQKIEAAKFGTRRGWQQDRHGEMREVIDISGGYSIGMIQSAQVLAGLAAELALKYVYEIEHPDAVAPQTHKLYDDLYSKLSVNRRDEIEDDYAVRIQRHERLPDEGWKTSEQAFRSANNYFPDWRYVAEEGNAIPYAQPVFLREAICSVLKTLGINIRWSEASK